MQLSAIQRSSTQARRRGDVTDKNNGQKINDKQSSAKGSTCLKRRHKGLLIYTPRVSGNWAGTLHSRAGTDSRRRMVNPTRRGSLTDRGHKPYPYSVKATVYGWISKMKGALLVMISTYVWNLGQTNPMVRNLCLVNTQLSYSIVACQGKYSCYRYQKPARTDQKRWRGLH